MNKAISVEFYFSKKFSNYSVDRVTLRKSDEKCADLNILKVKKFILMWTTRLYIGSFGCATWNGCNLCIFYGVLWRGYHSLFLPRACSHWKSFASWAENSHLTKACWRLLVDIRETPAGWLDEARVYPTTRELFCGALFVLTTRTMHSSSWRTHNRWQLIHYDYWHWG